MTNQGDSNNPTWSPDGQSIAFNSYRNNSLAFYVMDTDGKHSRRLTSCDMGSHLLLNLLGHRWKTDCLCCS
ncbi:PD40 domain-containing protein [Candidatus Poribacteria bacterium]|nr:PD40 domain-containing protein [Candidatus Poribacteria bacterium]